MKEDYIFPTVLIGFLLFIIVVLGCALIQNDIADQCQGASKHCQEESN